MLKLVEVRKVFEGSTENEQAALDSLSLSLEKGEFVTVIGSNGAGKSTMFNAIAGTFLIGSGSIELCGRDVTYEPEHVRARNIGRLFQDPKTGTAPDLTIEENLALVYSKATGRFALRRALRPSDREHFRGRLERFGMGLENRLGAKVGLLSGGQRQALALLIATLVPPELLLLDEHTAALDPVTATKIMDLTSSIARKDGITTMMITHNIKSALSMGTRTIMMDKGRVVLDISGEERAKMTVGSLLARYREKVNEELDNDRILLSEEEE